MRLSDEQLDAELEKTRKIIALTEKRKMREEKGLHLLQLQVQIKTGHCVEKLRQLKRQSLVSVCQQKSTPKSGCSSFVGAQGDLRGVVRPPRSR